MADSKPLNVGPKSAAWLRQVGVRTMDDLTALGSVAAFAKVRKAGFKPSLNLLYSLEGALRGCHWTALSPDEKTRLVTEANAIEDALKKAKTFVMPARDVTPARDRDGGDAPMEAPALFDEPDAGGDGGSDAGADGTGGGGSSD
jgi:hypothetical protein